jgi:nucleotide-binding universal stress UspA family protein
MTTETARPILLCYDGSEDAQRAVQFARDQLAGRRVVVVTAWEPYLPVFTGAPGWPVTGDAPMRDNASRLAAEGCERARACGLDASPRTQEADDGVARALLNAADDEDAGAIVVGSRGLTGVRRLVLGSVAHALVQHARRPVVVVPSRALADARAIAPAH